MCSQHELKFPNQKLKKKKNSHFTYLNNKYCKKGQKINKKKFEFLTI